MRDLRNRTGELRESLREDVVVLTTSGRPFALAIEVKEDEVEETAALIRRARAQWAVARMREKVSRRGDRFTEDDVETEIRASRVAAS